MSEIARARKELKALAAQLKASGNGAASEKLNDIVDKLMHREPVARRAPVHSNKVTPKIKAKIYHLAKTTDLHASEIANEVGVNPGRVSEVLNGLK